MIIIQSRPPVAKIVIWGNRLEKVVAQNRTRLKVVQGPATSGGANPDVIRAIVVEEIDALDDVIDGGNF